MRALIVVIVFLAGLGRPAFGQSRIGHVVALLHYRVLPGQEAAYSQLAQDKARPVLEAAVKRGVFVSYLDMVAEADSSGRSRVLMLEAPNAAVMNSVFLHLGSISQEVLGQPWTAYMAQVSTSAQFIKTEYFVVSGPS